MLQKVKGCGFIMLILKEKNENFVLDVGHYGQISKHSVYFMQNKRIAANIEGNWGIIISKP